MDVTICIANGYVCVPGLGRERPEDGIPQKEVNRAGTARGSGDSKAASSTDRVKVKGAVSGVLRDGASR
jgi:hypothetical protein